MTARRVRIEGRVQGVGFRAFVARTAASLGVEGEVWNTWDGAVEAHAQHASAEILDALTARLRAGPGRVDSVRTGPAEPNAIAGFHIGATRG